MSATKLIGLTLATILALTPPHDSGWRASDSKALVYCPVGIDTSGCSNIELALAPAFPGGIDRGFDGSGGTINLATADLSAYSLIVVPSLADGESLPYSVLREAAVAANLRAGIRGKVAFWSGTPDLGSANRESKNALLRNLAQFARSADSSEGPGMVALMDISGAVSSRYSWVTGITGIHVIADPTPSSYSSVRALTSAATAVLTAFPGSLAYSNMAAYGFQLPMGAAGVTLDAVGQTGTSVGGQVVMMTATVDAGPAVIMTDKDDYPPGMTVIMTGRGFSPAESITLRLTEDPEVHEERSFTVVADDSGSFVFTGFAPEEHDLDVRFVLVAIGGTSGRVAQTTFTDGNLGAISVAEPTSVTVAPGASANYTINAIMTGNINTCTVTFSVSTALPTGATAAFSPNPVNATNANFSTSLTISTSTGTPAGSSNFTVLATRGANCNGSGNPITSGTLVVNAPVIVATAVQGVSASASTFGALTNLSATVTPSGVTGTVDFYVNGSASPVSSTYNAGSGIATVTGYPHDLNASVTPYSVRAVFTPSGPSHSGSEATNTTALLVGKADASVIVTGFTGTYDGFPHGATGQAFGVLGADLSSLLDLGATYTNVPGGQANWVFAGNSNYNGQSGSVSIVIGIATQSITFGPLADRTFGDPSFALGATASSGLSVTYSASGNCAVTLVTVSLSGAGSCTITADQSGSTNYSAAAPVQQSFTIHKQPTTITLGTLLATYNGAGQGTTASTSELGAVGITITYNGSPVLPRNAGSYAVEATLDDEDYSAAAANGTFVISPLEIDGSFTAANKTYDGGTSAAAVTRTLSGDVPADDVELIGGTATFADKNVGTGKTVTLAGAALDGDDAGNYTLTGVSTTTADITPLAISGSFTADNKVYDANTSATVMTRSLSGDVPADDVSLDGGTATFDNKNVGTGKTVTLAGAVLAGADASNYTLSGVSTTTANISALGIAGSFTAANKIYDGGTSATVLTRSLIGALDDVELIGGTATFGTKDIGTGKTVTLAGATLDGDDAGNYTLTGVATTTADITPLAISGSFTADNKTYDGNTSATVLTRSLSGDVPADDVTLDGGTATFDSKNVGTAKTVTLAGAVLAGIDAGNYTLSGVATTTANIAALTIDGSFTADNKTYDGNTSATVLTRTLSGDVPADDVTLDGGTATFDNKNVGTSKTVTLAGAALAGADAGNYTLSGVATTTANIAALTIDGSFTADNKTYDGNTSATVLTRTLSGDVPSDDVTLDGGTATFDNKNVGTSKTVTLAGATLAGADAGNYSLTGVATTTASIAALEIDGSFTASNKTYDGNTSATVLTRSLSGDVLADDVTLDGGTATFDDKNVGTGKTVTLTGATLAGIDAGNYTLSGVATTTANIAALEIDGSFTASNKTYDGNTSATVLTRSLSGDVPADDVTLDGGTATFDNKNVGTGKTVTLAGATLAGADAGNYTLSGVSTTTADIGSLTISGSFTADDKTYDGNTSATVLTRTLSGDVPADDVTLIGGTAAFDNKNVGVGKIVALTGATLAGVDAGNYTLSGVATTSANITPKQLTATADNKSKIQGAANPPFTVTYAGWVTGENESLVAGTPNLSTTAVVMSGPGAYPIAWGGVAGVAAPNYDIVPVNGTLTVTPNAVHTITSVTATATPLAVVSGLATATLSFTDVDPSASFPYAISYQWGDGSTSTSSASAPGTYTSAPKTYSNAGVYTVTVTVTDKLGQLVEQAYTYVVVYDPSAGFVTGGGWIDSPIGACTLASCNDNTVGKASFGFNAQYKRGATRPDGNTNFHFKDGGLNFKSTSYDWLVIAGAKAQYKGVGTIAGLPGTFQFILTAIDGDIRGRGIADEFRIKITGSNGQVVYDNRRGTADDSDAGTTISGGSIVIHDGGNGKK